MEFEKIEITLNDTVNSTFGLELPAGVCFSVEENQQAYNAVNKIYFVYVKTFLNHTTCANGKSQIFIEGLHEVITEEPFVGEIVTELDFQINVNETDVDTNEKRKALIISKLAALLGKTVEQFS